jgi:hypothetical protein
MRVKTSSDCRNSIRLHMGRADGFVHQNRIRGGDGMH